MPQTTLSRSLKLTSASPPPSSKLKSPKKPASGIKNASKLSPAILKAKQTGAQGRFPGRTSSMEDDLRKLGLEPEVFLGPRMGRGGLGWILGNRETGVGASGGGANGAVEQGERTEIDHHAENKKVEMVAEVIALDGASSDDEVKPCVQKLTNKLLRGTSGASTTAATGPAGKGKEKGTGIAPTEEDGHPDSLDHQNAGVAVQLASDATVLSNTTTNNPTSLSGGAASAGEAGILTGKGRKRAPEEEEGGAAGREGTQKRKKDAYELHGKIAHPANARRVDADPPLEQLLRVQRDLWGNVAPQLNASPVKKPAASASAAVKGKPVRGKGKAEQVVLLDDVNGPRESTGLVGKGEAVVYWMRMEDIRVVDNHALSLANNYARANNVPLVVLWIATPGDWRAHDRGVRSIDFRLRNLRGLKKILKDKNIPLVVDTYTGNRFQLPQHVLKLLATLNSTHVFANIEYEVDELRRDVQLVKLGAQGVGASKVKAVFVHDRLAVPPGLLKSGKGTPYAVYSPWQRQWAAYLNNNPENLEEYPGPEPNDSTLRGVDPAFDTLFVDSKWAIPDEVAGFECRDRELMAKIWPEGTDKALQVLHKFLHGQARHDDLGLVDPLHQYVPDDETASASRIRDYASSRNSCDGNSSSRMSPYLASGVVSARMVLNKARALTKGKLESGRDSGVGMWVQEVAWRDFYNHVLTFAPRVSMGRPFLEQFSDVQWETDEAKLQAWKDGMTGFPIVDAAQRQANIMGWMHNRPRMICASFLVKDLMLDWRLGERFFMQSFIDGDLGMAMVCHQYRMTTGLEPKYIFSTTAIRCASTGTDPQPYFRIFNPTSQSETASPDGAYIRYWIPELRNLPDKVIHDPYGKLSKKEFEKLGYPKPIVDHSKSRARALFRQVQVHRDSCHAC
ncbi:hypothetical protein QFC21_005697 [Naganishia friedmannii]|uniref:Uncharacterized protein n=1 Tax=Naganishia friedmannii TaxID=89922 RepID=A0ACC2V8D3_9TREE|nr:hypothetical protein QFC21_005697 [Naganishia friedmannii]